jgi:transcriptional regulator with XRE-family HTH domain
MTRTKKLGVVLKERRKALGLTLAQVGAALDLANGNFVGMVERGERMPSDLKLLQVAKVLELNGRRLLALKYESTRGSGVPSLLKPPDPELPRLRRLLLDTCGNRSAMEKELALGERTALERVIFHALYEYVFVPAFDSDRHAPKRLKRKLAAFTKRRKSNPLVELDPWWFEEEAQDFAPWGREQLVSWTFDLATLTLRIRHSDEPGDVSTLPLVPGELRERMLLSVREESRRAAAARERTDLAGALRAEGLQEDDVEEILALVAIKKARVARSRAS